MSKVKNMIEYEPDELSIDDYTPYSDYNVKSKRLSLPEDYSYPLSSSAAQRHPIVEIIAWLFVGGVGLGLTAGSIIVAAGPPSGDQWVMLIPLLYMLVAMRWLRK